MRILALDWGTVRIGVAVSDEEGRIAFPLKHPILSGNKALEEIKQIVRESEVRLILLGLPKNLANQEGVTSKKLRKFADSLFGLINGVSIKLIDERFTSVQAGKILKSEGLSEKQQRGIKDNISAQIMLQQYLDNKNGQKETFHLQVS